MKKSVKQFDVIVIGAGSGLLISSDAAERGLRVAVIDEGPFGGTCLNRGCIPSKMLIHSADVINTVESAKEFGISAKVTKINWSQIQKRVWSTIDPDAKRIEKRNQELKNITVYKERAVFEGHKVLRVGDELLTAHKIFICAGSRPNIPQIPGLDDVEHHTSNDIMRLKRQPKSMIIIGGGYIGAELGHFFSSLGTKVTIVQRGDRLVPVTDEEISALFTKLTKKKFDVLLNAQTVLSRKGKKIQAEVTQGRKKTKITADVLLLATGRKPNSDVLNVEATGVKVNERGFVKVNEFMETNVPGIWAIGDICGIYMLKHSANLEAQYAAHNALNPKRKTPVDYTAMPYAVFASPQIGAVGATEQQLKKEHRRYAVGKYEYIHTGMGKAIEDKNGFVKVLVDPTNKKILGCHILGTGASTLIHEVIVAMKAGLTYDQLLNTVHIHPAMPEVVQRAFGSIEF